MVEFVSYDGRYPCLCSGTLTLRIDGKKVTFPRGCLVSGGLVTFDEDWHEEIFTDPWSVDPTEIPAEYHDRIAEIQDCVNKHVPFGCCGGCV